MPDRSKHSEWEFLGKFSCLLVDGVKVAVLSPSADPGSPECMWQSVIDEKRFPGMGWTKVDFHSLESGQRAISDWWSQYCAGKSWVELEAEAAQQVERMRSDLLAGLAANAS